MRAGSSRKMTAEMMYRVMKPDHRACPAVYEKKKHH